MSKNNTVLVGILLVLLLLYAIFFTSWFKPPVIKVFYTTRPIEHFRARYDLPYMLFILSGKYRLTEVKVVSLADFQKNSDATPLWHLISDSNSVPIGLFEYGEHIHGMRYAIKGEQPDDLETNVIYRLFVTAGRAHGQVDFKVK